MEFKGSVVALITPFKNDANQSVDHSKLAELIEFHAKNKTSSVIVTGTTGEAPTLEDAEFEQLLKTSVEAGKKYGIPILAGTGSNSTKKTVKYTAAAAEMGCAGALVVTPYYNKPSPAGLLAHFKRLDGIGIPMIVYNVPGRTGSNLEPSTLFTLAKECKNIVGLKAANGDLDQITETANLVRSLKKRYDILSGDDSLTLPIMAVGGTGIISVVANIIPKTMAALCTAFEKGEIELAQKIQYAVHEFSRACLRLGPNPCPIKTLMNKKGMNVGTLREPMVEVDSGVTEKLVQMLATLKTDIKNLGLESETYL